MTAAPDRARDPPPDPAHQQSMTCKGDFHQMTDTTAGDVSQETADTVTDNSAADADVSQETPTVEDLQAQLEEWKGHARKHEDRAKENHTRAKEYEATLTETEERALRLEQELAEAKAAPVEAVRQAFADVYRLDAAAVSLLNADTIDGLKQQVSALLEVRGTAAPGPTAPLEGTRPTIEPPAGGGTFGGQLGRALRDRDDLD